MTDLPAPLIAADVDLRSYKFMPLHVARLRDSDLAAVPDGEVFRAAVLSWCVAWHQVPAGSLPDDDAMLARLIGYGRDVKSWRKLRTAGALHGYVLCSDGRLYHPVVCEAAQDAWKERRRYQKAADARWKRDAQDDATHGATHDPIAPCDASSSAAQSHVQETGTVQGKHSTEKSEGEGAPSAPPPPQGLALIAEDQPDILPATLDRTPEGAIVKAWNAMASGRAIHAVAKLTPARRLALRARMREAGPEGIAAAMAKVAESNWCQGQNDRGWRADFDWFVSERGFTRITEGKFDNSTFTNGAAPDWDAFDRELAQRMGQA